VVGGELFAEDVDVAGSRWTFEDFLDRALKVVQRTDGRHWRREGVVQDAARGGEDESVFDRVDRHTTIEELSSEDAICAADATEHTRGRGIEPEDLADVLCPR